MKRMVASFAPKKIEGKRLAWLLTLLYCASYVTRINYAASLQAIITATGFPKADLAVIAVCMSITYGLGQIINGWIGDRVNPKNLLLCGLLLSSGINLMFPLTSVLLPRNTIIPAMVVLWAINGFAQAMMWPPIVKIMVAMMDEETYNYSVVRVSWGSSIGTILVYLIAPLIISLSNWRWMFICCAIFGFCVAVLWWALRSHVPYEAMILQPPQQADAVTSQKGKIPGKAILPLIFIGSAIIFQGMLRDGVTNWMPTYLSEVFRFDDTMSILCTVSLAIFSIITFGVAAWLYRRFFKNEVVCAAVIFAVAMLAAAVMFVFFGGGAVVAICSMALITGCMHGTNLMLITHVPKRFKKYGNISTMSGVINACTYVGAAISTYGIALLSEAIGWRNTVGVWALIALLGTACCLIASRPWSKMMD